ncbi:nicotinamidase [Octopus sinensis]|uniref:nicotinamidase n=1 Tax=Octopus sinensis TaxID=2607531 RepID=A0A6P7T815_9MOLL|nr:nicotinamidase [Octopus sinensis]XP_036365432.1 nicotinamidase [Octopus sinensis]XP_036365433.1 nicotinamidase [Octopus sinensis]XP_036365434.1 nicotinamidase [Octopus sinensis]
MSEKPNVISHNKRLTENFLDKYRRQPGETPKDEVDGSKDWCYDCFVHYDKNKDGFLDLDEFTEMLKDIFPESDSCAASISRELLELLDEDGDHLLGRQENRWQVWLNRVIRPISAILIIDVQNDFIDGTLSLKKCPAGQNGADVVPVINKLIKLVKFDLVVYSLDWHDDKHISFIDNLRTRTLHSSFTRSVEEIQLYDKVTFSLPAAQSQVLWPRHCVRGTWGAQLHRELYVAPGSVQVFKGTDTDVDSYSAFFDNNRASQTQLFSILQSHNVTDVYVCGIAYDVCVKYTALDALHLGFQTHLIDDASKGVKLEDIETTKTDLVEKGCCLLQSQQISENLSKAFQNIDRGLWIARALSNVSCVS